MRTSTCHPEAKHFCKGLCKPCYQAKWHKENPRSPEDKEKRAAWGRANPDRLRAAHFKAKYGITLEQYDEMNARQNGRCAICVQECSVWPRLSVDHCHETGRVRGLLCHECNTGLGKFKNDQALLGMAARYLQAP